MLTVRQFLQLPAFKDVHLMAGEKALDNIIQSVNIMDNPEALDWFAPGEMLVTSGYFFKDGSDIQEKTLRQLRRINCPALCIKPKKYFGTIPQNIITLANEIDLPVIELPYGVSFGKITSEVLQQTSDKYDILNKKSLDIHEEFFKISLEGGGLSMICSSLSTMIKNPVILLDQFWNVLHYTALPNDPCSMKDLLELKPNESFLDSAFLDTLPLAFETLKKPITRQVQVKGESICSVIMPVNIGATHHGYIFVWNTFKDLVEIDYIALENAAMSFALERTRTKELDRTKNRIRRDFFDELLSGKITNQENLQYLCDLHGLNSNLFYTPMVVELRLNIHSDNDLVLNKQQEDSTIRQSVHTLEDYGISKSLIFHVFHQYRKIIILMGTSPKDNLINLDDMKNLGNEIINTLEKEITDSSFHLGIGRTSTSLLEIEKSFIEAKEALRLVQKSSDAKKVCHFEDFVVHHFLEENISEIEMRKFFHNALGPIYQYDKKYSSELISTLETWISHHFNVAETARALFTHRNTVLYRMDRISTILQSDLKNADEILKYQLALKIYHLLGLN